MNKNLFYGVLIFVLAVTVSAYGDKYSEAVDINHQFAAAMETYIDALSEAHSAESVASSMNTYAEKIEKIALVIVEIAEKYPDLRTEENVPEELTKSRERIAETSKKMGSVKENIEKYMSDPIVEKAQARLKNAMAILAPMKKE